jgi:taurine dioxygenase
MEVRRLGGTLGAEVVGVDLGSLDDEGFGAVHAALLEHHVLAFRDQSLDPPSQIAFMRRFGPVIVYPGDEQQECPEVRTLANSPSGRMRDGRVRKVTEVWHSDSSYWEAPPGHALLVAKELPPAGGDTLFANQHAAYDALSETMQRVLVGLRAVHRVPAYVDPEAPAVSHPAVISHPETGRKALYVNPNAVAEFEGMTERESRGLLEFLFAHAVQPEFVYRHRWLPGDALLWDNRATQHYAVDDYGDAPRVMHRSSLVGDRPR